MHCLQGLWVEEGWNRLAMDMLHLHPGVPHHYVQDPGNVATPEELQQLANDAAQVVAQQASAMMQRWFQACELEGILPECQGTTAAWLSFP
jgi:hypothetical protein